VEEHTLSAENFSAHVVKHITFWGLSKTNLPQKGSGSALKWLSSSKRVSSPESANNFLLFRFCPTA